MKFAMFMDIMKFHILLLRVGSESSKPVKSSLKILNVLESKSKIPIINKLIENDVRLTVRELDCMSGISPARVHFI